VHPRQTCIRRTPSTGAAGRIFAIALVLVLGISVSIDRAAAQGRTSRAIGAGIAGALILNELSKGTGKRKAATPRRSKRSTTARVSRPAKQRDKDGTVAVKKETEESSGSKAGIEAGSTAMPAKAAAAGGAAVISSPDEIKAAQQHLRFMGYDITQENGVVDAKTKSAVMQFQDSIGAPVTGDLTVDQLQMLFVKVAEGRAGS
jgi:hypothetical protein